MSATDAAGTRPRVTTTAASAPTDATSILEVQGVTVRFGGLTAGGDVSLAVPPKTIVGLVGPNGAGKSTIFNVASGVLRPQSGHVLLGGQDVTRWSVEKRARAGLGRTFQHPEVFTALTVRENVVLAHRMRYQRSRIWSDFFTAAGFRRGQASENEAVDGILEQVGLAPIAEQTALGLPLGYARLLEVARAIALGPRIILMDEPTSGLDSRETDRLSSVLRTLVDQRDVSLLLVEHDVALVLGLSSHVYVVDFGKLIASGTPAQIRDDDVVKAAYFGKDEQGL